MTFDSLAAIPPDVVQVADRDGDTWQRHPKLPDLWAMTTWITPDPGSARYWHFDHDLTAAWAPFTPVPTTPEESAVDRPLLRATQQIAAWGLSEPDSLTTCHHGTVLARLDTLDAFITYAERLKPREIAAHRGPRGTRYVFTVDGIDVGHVYDHDPGSPAVRSVTVDDLRDLAVDVERAQDSNATPGGA